MEIGTLENYLKWKFGKLKLKNRNFEELFEMEVLKLFENWNYESYLKNWSLESYQNIKKQEKDKWLLGAYAKVTMQSESTMGWVQGGEKPLNDVHRP